MSANGRISNDKNKGKVKCDLILRISFKQPPGRESVEGVLGGGGVSLRFSPLDPDHYKFVDFPNLFDKRNYLHCDMSTKGSRVSTEFLSNLTQNPQ